MAKKQSRRNDSDETATVPPGTGTARQDDRGWKGNGKEPDLSGMKNLTSEFGESEKQEIVRSKITSDINPQ